MSRAGQGFVEGDERFVAEGWRYVVTSRRGGEDCDGVYSGFEQQVDSNFRDTLVGHGNWWLVSR